MKNLISLDRKGFRKMMRIPKTFSYPVVYPNGVVIYCDNEKEQQRLREQIKEWFNFDEENTEK